jgi:hypothetical protein
MSVVEYTEAPVISAERGRELVNAGQYQPPTMIDSLSVCAYLAQQRDLVATYGDCSGGCRESKQIEHPATGRVVCPRTLQACPRVRLALIVQQFESLFSGSDNVSHY